MVEAAVLNPEASDRPLRVLVLTIKPKGLSPGQRFRLEQWAGPLAARHDVTMDFVPFESSELTSLLYRQGHTGRKVYRVARDFVRRASAVLRARRYDAVIVYREAALIGPAFYERLLARSGVPMFFDFDDAIWSPAQDAGSVNGVFSKLHFWGKTSTTCRIATGVIAGNSYLADYARRRNDNVAIIPTTIDLDDYPVQPEPAADEPFIVGWTGSLSTLQHFEFARGALEGLARQRKVQVKVICNEPPARPIEGAENVFIRWSEDREAENVGACHVGIMPLPDNPYTRGKCGLKAIQFMATGRPVVIAPVGMNKDLIVHGVNGFLASTEDQWVEQLNALAESPALRARIGAAGRKTVEAGYSAEVGAERLAAALRERVRAR